MVRRFNRKVVENTVGTIRPTSDRLLVEMLPVESEFHIPKGFTIYVPPSNDHQRMIAWGTIRVLGAGRPNKKTGEFDPWPDDFKIGKRAVFGKFAGTELMIEGVEHRIMRLSEILALGDPPEE